jgi:hypothetical protein
MDMAEPATAPAALASHSQAASESPFMWLIPLARQQGAPLSAPLSVRHCGRSASFRFQIAEDGALGASPGGAQQQGCHSPRAPMVRRQSHKLEFRSNEIGLQLAGGRPVRRHGVQMLCIRVIFVMSGTFTADADWVPIG